MYSIFLVFAFIFSTVLQGYGHTLIEPALGVSGTGSRSDVQRPSDTEPCGTVNVSSAISSSTVVKTTNNSFVVTVQNFNGGTDGSRQVTAKVDPTGTGKNFTTAADVTKNGDLSPASAGTQQVDTSLPDGINCTGGTDGRTCLVSFITAGGFGNCVLVSQDIGTDSISSSSSASVSNGNSTSKSTSKTCSKVGNTNNTIAHGTRKARAMLASYEELFS